MFDWNDEELTGIIWGEAGEGEDHIVTHPDGDQENPPDIYVDHIEKELNQEDIYLKSGEQKKAVSRTDLQEIKLESKSQYDRDDGLHTTEFSTESWPDLSLQSINKTEHDIMVTKVSNDTMVVHKQALRSDMTAPLDNASEVFQCPLEGSEQGDFVDYGWSTVGSFEDLDRIFSTDDQLFGHASLSNTEELWSSSKDVTSSPEKFISLSVNCPNLGLEPENHTPAPFDVKAEYQSDQNLSLTPGYEKLDLYPSNVSEDNKSYKETVKYVRGKSRHLLKEKASTEMAGNTPILNSPLDAASLLAKNDFIDKLSSCVQGNRQKRSLKGLKKLEGKIEARNSPDRPGTWAQTANQFSQYDSRCTPVVGQPISPMVFSQQAQIQGLESSQYKNFRTPIVSLMNSNVVKQYTPLNVLPQYSSGEGSQHQVPPSYHALVGNLNCLNMSTESPIKSVTMTPQEKIEKLRRRHQMRAMLAIQKQQQQLRNQVLSADYSVMEGESIEAEESLSNLPSHELNPPLEQDDSNTAPLGLDGCSVQDSILVRLQEIVAKLDCQIRLCIRDSLFRLAQSARQRQYASDTNSSSHNNRGEVLKEEKKSDNRFLRTPDVETETNPIDRTVAHLLFHRPPEVLGKLVETTESPLLSNLLPYERTATSSMNLQMTSIPQRSENKQILTGEESIFHCLFSEGDPLGISPCLDTSEVTSSTVGIV